MHTEKDCNLDIVNAALKDLGLKHVDCKIIKQMQAEGMTNKQIYEQLGITKATFYLKLKEYNQNL